MINDNTIKEPWQCGIPDCTSELPHQGHGWCRLHYTRWYHHGDPLWEPPEVACHQKCSIIWCAEIVGKGGHGMCAPHYMKCKRWGNPFGKVVQMRLIKPCSRCSEWKSLGEFAKDNRRPDGRQSFCLPCSRNWQNAHPDEMREYKRGRGDHHIRRAKMRGVQSEPMTFQEIGDRDKWICWLCKAPIDPTLKWPHHWSRSIDHVIPISQGGSHTKDNVKITHYSCNARRGAKPHDEQLPLRMPASC